MNQYHITCNVCVEYLLKDRIGTRRFYDILVSVSEISIINRWIDQLGNINDK